MSSTSNVMYVETPVVRFRGKMWNVMMSCAYLQDKGKMCRMDSNIDDETHHMSIFDKYMPADRNYAEAIDAFLHVYDSALESDLTSFYKLNEPYHVKAFKPHTTTDGVRQITVKMIDGDELDGGPGGRNQDVLVLTVGKRDFTMRRVKFIPTFVSKHDIKTLDERKWYSSAGI
jgi:hypothetical protein